MKLFWQVAFIVLVSAGFSIVHGLILSATGQLGETDELAITISEAKVLESALWVDARSYEAFSADHYPEAIPLNEDDWEGGLGSLIMVWDPERPIIVYCDGGGCASSRKIAERLAQELGIENVYWLVDGWEAIQRAGIEP